MPFNRIFFCFLIISLLFLFGGCRESQKPDTDMDAFPEIQDKKEEALTPDSPKKFPQSKKEQEKQNTLDKKENPADFSDEEKSFLSTLTFLGDSTTAHMISRAPLPDGGQNCVWATRNRYLNLDPHITEAKIVCPGNSEEMTIAEAAAAVHPARLVITLGVDYGVYYYRNNPLAFRRCYQKLLDAISAASPDTELILQSIFPVAASCRVIDADMIKKANAEIKKLADERDLLYVDAGGAVLADENGYLRPEFLYSEDGIHLNQAAYTAILKNLCRYQTQTESSS